jgi:hypothetical protein
MRRPALVALALLAGCSDSGLTKSGTCRSNRDCPSTMACISGQCQANAASTHCRTDEACGTASFCDVTDGLCKPVLASSMDDRTPDAGAPTTGSTDSGSVTTDSPDTGAGAAPDATPSAIDATAPPPTDAGEPAPMDASAPPMDAATPPIDASAPPVDASTPPMDASAGPMDAAASQPDAAAPPDSGPAPPSLELGASCASDDQCISGICLAFTIGTASLQVCTTGCARGGDCPLHSSCTDVSGMSFCLGEAVFGSPPPSFATPAGGACTSTMNTCQSGWCNTAQSSCLETCSRPSDCGGSNCYTYAQTDMSTTPATTTYDHLCYSPGTGTADGTPCLADSDCVSGICDRYALKCARQCCSDTDCAPDESCGVYDLDPTTPVKICIARASASGTAPLGVSCAQASDCESEVCVPIDPASASSPKRCSTTCCTDLDCQALPSGGACRPFTGPMMGTLIGACVPR